MGTDDQVRLTTSSEGLKVNRVQFFMCYVDVVAWVIWGVKCMLIMGYLFVWKVFCERVVCTLLCPVVENQILENNL